MYYYRTQYGFESRNAPSDDLTNMQEITELEFVAEAAKIEEEIRLETEAMLAEEQGGEELNAD